VLLPSEAGPIPSADISGPVLCREPPSEHLGTKPEIISNRKWRILADSAANDSFDTFYIFLLSVWWWLPLMLLVSQCTMMLIE